MTKERRYKNKITDYQDTIFAILGFINIFQFDDETRSMRDDVIVFQGRRLQHFQHLDNLNDKNNAFHESSIKVTPDIGIIYSSKKGVLAEVKKSFCSNKEFWIKDFEQLMSYDGRIEGWPTSDGKIDNHEISLLLHQSRAFAVKDYYLSKLNNEIFFEKPFSIIEFNRSDEAVPYLFFRLYHGSLREEKINNKLHEGIQIKMEIFSNIYSEIKLYDAEPPCPYLLEIIWNNVILPHAIEDVRFQEMRKNSKLEVAVNVNEIVTILNENFSFKKLHDDNEFQPQIPHKNWIVNAFDVLVRANEGRWINRNKGEFSIIFRKYDEVLEHFITICSSNSEELEKEEQPELFEDLDEVQSY